MRCSINQSINQSKLILTAVDNNDTFWYDLLLPFLITLKKTDYNGDIGIISYGLSQEKIEVLKRHGCLIFEGACQYPEIVLDRFISTSNIVSQTDYEQIALIDADIWFPQPHFSLFEQLTDNEKMYCAQDLWRCGFLIDCIHSEYILEINQQIDQVEQKFGRVWQVGVCMATKQTWLHYVNYLEDKLAQSHIYKAIYGVDSTIMNLYSAELDKIALLPEKYNCLPIAGIQCLDKGDGVRHLINGELVEGLHVTRNHRKDKFFAYTRLHLDTYMAEGKSYNLRKIWYITLESILEHDKNVNEDAIVWKIEYAEATHLDVVFDDEKQGVVITVNGCSCLRFYNDSDQPKQLFFHFEQAVPNELSQQVFARTQYDGLLIPGVFYGYLVQPHSHIELVTKELNHDKRVRWCFYNTKFVI